MAIKLNTDSLHGKFSDEDITPHDSVTAIISKGYGEKCRYLMMDHVKHNMITPCVGKVKSDQSLLEGLMAETKEELGIKPTEYQELFQFTKTYAYDDVKVKVKMHVFKIVKFTGTITNKEPKKCKGISWMTRSEIEKSKRKKADAIMAYFQWLDDVNSVSLVKPGVTVGQGHA